MILITSILFTLTNFTHHDIVCYSMIYFRRANYVLPTLICMWGRGPWPKAEGFFLFMWHYTTIAEYSWRHQCTLFALPHCRHLLGGRNIISEPQQERLRSEGRLKRHCKFVHNRHTYCLNHL
nr:MAG TPA: hypothetical protein [Herelleviridae sp.]DAJ08769.1 MAG TPA: hypothetical protein [Caudoviricetes sp.]